MSDNSRPDLPLVVVSREAIEGRSRDVMAEIQAKLVDEVIEREIAALAVFTGEDFARHVYRYPISFYMPADGGDGLDP